MGKHVRKCPRVQAVIVSSGFGDKLRSSYGIDPDKFKDKPSQSFFGPGPGDGGRHGPETPVEPQRAVCLSEDSRREVHDSMLRALIEGSVRLSFFNNTRVRYVNDKGSP